MANPFGASSSPFGASQAANPFATPTQQGSAFGAPTTPATGFGAASPFGQPGGSLFGASTGFGASAASTPAFGAASSSSVFGASSTPAFGSSPSPFGSSLFGQQQRPAGAFGSFGATQPAANPFGASPFGQASQPAFGSTTTPTFGAPTTPAFGASSPAFGGTPAFGASTSAFGAASTPAFGSAGSAPAFGSGGGLFGGASTSPAFGQSTPAFGSLGSTPAFGAGAGGFGGGAAGSRAVRFQATQEDPTPGATPTQLGVFQTITAMPQYRNKSVEELRWEDYQKGDKGGAAPPGGTGGLFGQTQASPFGATPAFGAAASSSPFGATTTTPSLFGSTAPAFGAASTPAFGAGSTPAFGASSTPSLFGAASAPAFGAASTPAFGASSTPAFGLSAASTAFGAAASSSPFGTTTLGAGQPGANPFGASTSLFGAAARPPGTPATGFTGFGTTPASTPAFGAPGTGGSLFGTPGAATGTGLFGASQPAGSTGFGASTGFGFGSGSMFGASTAGGGLFGSSAAPASTGLFGSTGSSFGFGSSFQTRPAGLAQSSSPLSFGAFGSGATAQTGAGFGFGMGSTPQTGTGLFGASTPSLFGSATGAQAGGLGTPGLFPPMPGAQNSAQQQQQQQTMMQQAEQNAHQILLRQVALQQLSLAGQVLQTPFGVLPPFESPFKAGTAASGAPGVAQALGAPEAGIANLPRQTERRLARTRATSLRLMTPPARLGRVRTYNRARELLQKSLMLAPAPEGSPKVPFFYASSELGGGVPRADTLFVPRENPRALFFRTPVPEVPSPVAPALPAKPVAADVVPSAPPMEGDFGEDASGGGRDAAWLAEARRKGKMLEGTSTPPPLAPAAQSSPFAVPERTSPAAAIASPSPAAPEQDARVQAALPRLRSSDWYTVPSLAELAARERAQPGYVKAVKDFTVGRRGKGSVKFLGATDVTGLELEDLIEFPGRELVVYPDEDSKPDVGKELNKPAEVMLVGIYGRDKATGERILAGDALQKFMTRLRAKTTEQGADFISYDPSDGTWTFRVKHFSRYGLDDSDDDMEADVAGPSRPVAAAGASGGTGPGGPMTGGHMAGNTEAKGVGEEDEDESDPDVLDPDLPGSEDPALDGDDAGPPRQLAGDDLRAKERELLVKLGFAQGGLETLIPAESGVDLRKVNQMRAALFGGSSKDATEPQVTPARMPPQQQDYPTPAYREATRAGLLPSPALEQSLRSPGQQALTLPGSKQLQPGLKVSLNGSPLLIRIRPNPPLTEPEQALNGDTTAFPNAAGEEAPPQQQYQGGGAFPEPALERLRGWSGTKAAPGTPEAGFDEGSIAGPGSVEDAAPVVYREHAIAADVGVDAALLLGRSFRVGWGPGGVLVHPGYAAARGEDSMEDVGPKPLSSRVRIWKVAFNPMLHDAGGELVPRRVELCLIEPLLLHLNMSQLALAGTPVPAGTGGEEDPDSEVALWRTRALQCKRDQDLTSVCQEYAALADVAAQEAVPGGDGEGGGRGGRYRDGVGERLPGPRA